MSHEDDNAFANNPIEEVSIKKGKQIKFLAIARQKSGSYLKVIKDI